jgi:BirA family transcriptional regulator, biotin operon repressor / biotin---[acetyl-CoA-carboxylase] ligase
MTLNWLNKYGLLIFDHIDSTNLEAHRLLKHGINKNLVILAGSQKEGRGRYGRYWHSPKGNLYLSLLLKHNTAISSLSQYTFVASLSMANAIFELLGKDIDLKLKWPNDILLTDKKISGILLESISNIQYNVASWLIIGIGVNLKLCPQGLQYSVTSLEAEGYKDIIPELLLDRFMQHFSVNCNLLQKKGFMDLKNRWLKHAWCLGEMFSCCIKGKQISGIFSGVGENGDFLLKSKDGTVNRINSGEVFKEPLQNDFFNKKLSVQI